MIHNVVDARIRFQQILALFLFLMLKAASYKVLSLRTVFSFNLFQKDKKFLLLLDVQQARQTYF